jgi:RND family efflux transporter MFP subunit
MNRTRLATTCLLCILGLVTACQHRPAGDEEEEGAAPSATAVAEVTVTRVSRATLTQTVTISGTVTALPDADVRISPLVAGRVARIFAIEGQRVRRGQLLAELDSRPYRDRLHQAEAALAQAQATLDNARASYARNRDLYQRGIAARRELEAAQTELRVAEATVHQAQAALQLARLDLERTRIVSPLDGVLVRRFVNPGEQVDGTAAQPVVEVARLAPVDLLAEVPASYLSRLRPGQNLGFSSPVFPGRRFTAQVVAVAPAVDPATNIGQVRLRFSNADGALRLGMFLSGELPVAVHADVLAVPAAAVYRDEQGRSIVYRVEGDRATAVPVTTGLESHGVVELTCCVHEGETVILGGGYGLPAQARIRVRP